MRYHDGVDDEDETYHKTEWSLPPYVVYNVGVILVNIITLILASCTNQTAKLTSSWRWTASQTETENINLPFVALRSSFATVQWVQWLCHPTHCIVMFIVFSEGILFTAIREMIMVLLISVSSS